MWAIILHGGAREIEPDEVEANRSGCMQALSAGQAILEEGGSAMDAVEAALRVLEDDPTFNCGYGSDLNEAGEVEMCAAVMEGGTFNVGGVSIIQGVRHPVSVAKAMLTEETILIAGPGARAFAAEKGLDLCRPEDLKVPKERHGLRKVAGHDTVGCVALDQQGLLVAGTSTGGLEGTHVGRIGDSPMPGCGYYADNAIGAVAFSGDGEHIAHSGGFHADELLSSVILTRLHPQARIVRSRDEAWITPAADRVIYDVGRDHDPERLIFDHHQKNPPLREDGQPYSSIGLIWRHFGTDYLRALDVPERDLDPIHVAFDADFVLPIDLVDNGALSPTGPLADLSLPLLLESLKPVFDDRDPKADDLAFDRALSVARAFVEAAVARKAAKLRAEAVVMEGIAAAGDSPILELPVGMPFRAAIEKAGADHLLFVIHPRETDWTLTGIRRDAEGFALRADLPEAWAGLTDTAFEAASGVPGARFCHNGRFIAVAADRESALQLAALAAQHAEAPETSE